MFPNENLCGIGRPARGRRSAPPAQLSDAAIAAHLDGVVIYADKCRCGGFLRRRFSTSMQPHGEENFEEMMRQIRALPAERQHDALLQFTSLVLRSLDEETIANMRDEIDTALGRTDAGRDILNLVDGHMVWREIQEAREL